MRYRFNEVKTALLKHWGLSLTRGSVADPKRDGRWDTSHSRTGFIVSGQFPGNGHSQVRYDSLRQIVEACDLAKVIAASRR